MKRLLVVHALLLPLALAASCAGPASPTPTTQPPSPTQANTPTPCPTPTRTSVPTSTSTHTPTPKPPPTYTPSASPTPTPIQGLPPELAWDFYPNGLTRDDLLARLASAVQKTGHIVQDETWSGTIHITGDVQVDAGVTLVMEPGTLVLIAARQDDQHAGHQVPVADFNPKDPPLDGTQRVELQIQGNLVVRGTAEAPVIITSDATSPQNHDWRGILVADPGSTAEITRAIIEFFRAMGIGSPDVVIRQSILRNMMECVVIGSTGPETDPKTALDLTPTLTQNYIYNAGRSAITVLSGAPTISHNVVRARPDMDTTGWEDGAFSTNWPTCPVIHHNYFDGGQPRPYGGEIYGQYYEFTEPHGAGLMGVCPFTFEFNTVTASPMAMSIHMGPGSLQHNNIIPVAATGPYAQSAYGRLWLRPRTCIFAFDRRPVPSDEEWEFLDQMGAIPLPLVQVVSAPNNYWGTSDPEEIEECMHAGAAGLRIEYRPFATEFIAEALPNWREFQW